MPSDTEIAPRATLKRVADPQPCGAPSGHVPSVREVREVLDVRDARRAAGAGFIVAGRGDIMIMPGLPGVPSAEAIDLSGHGEVVGPF